MKKELNDLLCERYPLVLSTHYLTCGDGWFDLIDVLCEQLQNEIDKNGGPQVVINEVGEKYGGLRFYFNSGNARQSGMIDMAEALSERICEECGKPGRMLVDHDWFMTRCPAHAPAGAITEEEYVARLEAPQVR